MDIIKWIWAANWMVNIRRFNSLYSTAMFFSSNSNVALWSNSDRMPNWKKKGLDVCDKKDFFGFVRRFFFVGLVNTITLGTISTRFTKHKSIRINIMNIFLIRIAQFYTFYRKTYPLKFERIYLLNKANKKKIWV